MLFITYDLNTEFTVNKSDLKVHRLTMTIDIHVRCKPPLKSGATNMVVISTRVFVLSCQLP